MYNGLKRVSEGGLEGGFPLALKVAVGEGIVAFKVRKQRLLSQCLFYGDNDKVKNAFTNYLTLILCEPSTIILNSFSSSSSAVCAKATAIFLKFVTSDLRPMTRAL